LRTASVGGESGKELIEILRKKKGENMGSSHLKKKKASETERDVPPPKKIPQPDSNLTNKMEAKEGSSCGSR